MPDDLPDARDGLTRKQRLVLWVLSKLEAERPGRSIPLPMLYGRVLEHVDLSVDELRKIVADLSSTRADAPRGGSRSRGGRRPR